MITPAYSPTATERVLPRLALDFTTASLDARVTVARALNTATRVNSSGLVEVVNADLPRFDYDPVTLVCKGLLIEEARTNLLLNSEQLSSTGWNPTNCTVTLNATTSPSGTTTADKVIANNGLAGGNTFAIPALAPTTVYTFSAFAKKSEWSWLLLQLRSQSGDDKQAWFDLDAGTVGTVTAGATATITNFGNGWYRCTLTMTSGALADSERARISPTNADNTNSVGDGTSGIFVWGAQLEAGAFATSYIPTTTSSLTRNADVVTMTGTNFSDWYNASEGTFVARFLSYTGAAINNPRILAVSDGSTANRIRSFLATTSTTTQVNSGGSSQASLSNTPTTLYGTFNKLAVAYKADSFASSINGGAVTTDTAGLVPVAPIRLNIGADFDAAAATQLNGYISNLLYYPQRLINAETQAFSK